MKYYLVRSIGMPTKENEAFREMEVNFCGKGDKILSYNDVYGTFSNYFLSEYGYTRAADAKRNYTYKYPERSQYWQFSSDVVEIDTDKIGHNYRDYINRLKAKWMHRRVKYFGEWCSVVDVDYNGMLYLKTPWQERPMAVEATSVQVN